MNSFLYHIQLNISFKNLSFYQKLMALLGWEVIFSTNEVVGYHSKTTGDLWLVDCLADKSQDYDLKGVNHISIRVSEQNDVDSVVEFLQKNNVKSLFETPRHRPEFSSSESETYFQVMFKAPDDILFEVVYVGSKDN